MMNEQEKKCLQPVRVIVITMSLGLMVFSVVTVVMVTGKMIEPNPDVENLQNILVALLVVLAMGESVAYFVMRGAMRKKLRLQWQDGKSNTGGGAGASGNSVGSAQSHAGCSDEDFHKTLATITILGCAMAEGLGLLGAVIALLTGNLLMLIFSGDALFVLLSQLPTDEKLRALKSHVTGKLE